MMIGGGALLRDIIAGGALAASAAMTAISMRPARNASLLLTPSLPGSMGDAAMVESSAAMIGKETGGGVDLSSALAWPVASVFREQRDYDGLCDEARRLTLARAFPTLRSYQRCVMIGADILDGVYNPVPVLGRLRVLDAVAKGGRKGLILGSSFSATPNAEVVKALRGLSHDIVVCARDEISYKRMEVLDRPVRMVADVAFLLKPNPDHPGAVAAKAWIDARKAAGDQIVGLNINAIQEEKVAGFADSMAALAATLLKKPISILLVPHDTRTARSDLRLAQDVLASLPPEVSDRVHLLPPESPSMFKATLAHIDLIVTGRMHAAILAMGAGTPAFCFVYQGKFEGLYRLLGLEDADLLMAPEAAVEDLPSVVERISSALARKGELRAVIASNIEKANALSRRNFEGL